MADARLRALSTVRQLADHQLEEATSVLTALQRQIAVLQNEKMRLRHKAAHEGLIASAESAPYVARFLRSVRSEEVQIDAEIARLVQMAAGHEEQVRTRYREAKMFHTVEDRHREDLRRRAEAKARQTLDDLSVMRWARD